MNFRIDVDGSLSIDKHVCITIASTKLGLKCTTLYRGHSTIIKLIPILNKRLIRILNRKTTLTIIQINPFLLFLVVLLIILLLFFICVILVLLSFVLFFHFFSHMILCIKFLNFYFGWTFFESLFFFEIPVAFAQIVFYVCVVVTAICSSAVDNYTLELIDMFVR